MILKNKDSRIVINGGKGKKKKSSKGTTEKLVRANEWLKNERKN